MILVASLAIQKSVFGLHRRGWDACRPGQDDPIFHSFFDGSSPTLFGSLFPLLFVNFIVFGPPLGSLGPHFFEVFPGVEPIGTRIAPPLGPGKENGATGLQKDAKSAPK